MNVVEEEVLPPVASRPRRKVKNEKIKTGLQPRERVPFDQRRTASSTEWERRQASERTNRGGRRRPGNNSKKESRGGKGGMLKLENNQARDLETFVDKKRIHSGERNPTGDSDGTRVLGEKPTVADLKKVTFRQSNKFRMGEVVVVPRTRGGFSYAKIIQTCVRNRCYLDPTKPVKYREWRAVYPHANKSLFKDLPSVFIGKLEEKKEAVPIQILKKDEEEPKAREEPSEDVDEDFDGIEDDVDGETIMFCGMGRVVVSDGTEQSVEPTTNVSKPESTEDALVEEEEDNEGEDDTSERKVGSRIWESDTESVAFAPHSSFVADEIAVVPRSAGGFTYGKVLGPWNCNCPLGEGHKHPGWRVIIDEKKTPRVVKDLLSVNIGKLHLAGVRPAEIPDPNPPQQGDKRQLDQPALARERVVSPRMVGLPKHGGDEPEDVDDLLDDTVDTNEPPPEITGYALHPSPSMVPAQVHPVMADPFAGMFPSVSADAGRTQKGGILNVTIPAETANRSNKRDNASRQGNNNNNNNNRRRGKKKASGQQKPVIVLDGPNIAMKHGKQKVLSVRGIQIAAEYYRRKGNDVISFLPQHYATKKPPSGAFKLQEFLPLADDLPLLEQLVEEGFIVLTPAQDYDDSYCIEYAKRHSACIVSNDRYRDHIDKQPEHMKPRVRKWLREHLISYTFVRDEFLPNPDFVFPPKEGESTTNSGNSTKNDPKEDFPEEGESEGAS